MKTYFIKYGVISLRIALNFQTTVGPLSFVEELESSVIISISDNGIGMEQEEMDRIFDRFYKVDTARARNVEGSGLGLSIVQKIVELHNGNVSVYSTKGKGLLFGWNF